MREKNLKSLTHRTEHFKDILEIMLMYDDIFTHVMFLTFFSEQKVADDKGSKAKKGGAKGKKDDGPAQNGETKTNEV